MARPTNAAIVPDEAQGAEIRSLRQVLDDVERESDTPFILGRNGQKVPIPAAVTAVLLEAVLQMERGKAVAVVPAARDLTTQEAADILNMSRPSLIALLEGGHLPFHRVGAHRRIALDDVIEFRQRRSSARKGQLAEIARESQQLGDYLS